MSFTFYNTYAISQEHFIICIITICKWILLKILIIAGSILLLAGIAFYCKDKIPFQAGFQTNIVLKKKSLTVYVPTARSLLPSIIFSLILILISRFNK
jgi:hypothetical protein